MKLVYLWIDNYKDLVIKQDFQITKDLLINVDSEYYNEGIYDLKITIKENFEYKKSKGLYGSGIIDATAIVGENGAGKTTIATMLMDYMSIIPDFEQSENKAAVYIFFDVNQGL